MQRFEDRVAVVTGGGAGIGEATCERFAREGANLVVIDWDGDAARETADRLERAHDAATVAVEADVGDESDVERALEECAGRFGRLDVLVNNAGVRVEPGPVTEVDEERLERILRVNQKGVVYGVKHAVPLMLEGGGEGGSEGEDESGGESEGTGGAIVNVASVGAAVARAGWSLYDGTKGAIVAMTKDMACDHAEQGIRVNAISPGYVVTDYHVGDRTGEEAAEFVDRETTPREDGPGILRRAGTPDEIAGSIAYLASEDASYVTGANLAVDGGASLTGL